MTLDEFRSEMEAYWQSVHKEANKFKDPHIAQKRMYALYRKFDAEERALADQVLAEWVLLEDSMQFVTLALIEDFRITKAIPALQKLAKRLTSSRAPGARFELEKVSQIIADLSRCAGTYP
jgi:hypothetical protein